MTEPTIKITPDTEDWRFLSFAVHEPESATDVDVEGQETAIVPLSGTVNVTVDGKDVELQPDIGFRTNAHHRVRTPGGEAHHRRPGAVRRGIGPGRGLVSGAGLRARRNEDRTPWRWTGLPPGSARPLASIASGTLILYEVYVPRGTWRGWPPHCHDGYDGSPYLEEVYYFRTDPAEGFVHASQLAEDEPFDETHVANDGETVTVPKGYHSSVACPSSHMFFLNYLAGEPQDDERKTPPCFHSAYTWIEDDWTAQGWELPIVAP